MLRDAKVLITGGTGYLGRHLILRFLELGVKSIIAYARDEKKHYELRNSFTEAGGRVKSVIGDVRDADRLRQAVKGTDIIIHAAAMKHITHCEDAPGEAYRTNVVGAENLIRVVEPGQKVVYISTDKAVAPCNVYGATKMIQEGLFRSATEVDAVGVRYGNVLSSTGSVVPFFRQQARLHQTLTVTHPEMTRFLITAREAVSLVETALECRRGMIIVPMPRSAKMSDLAAVFAEKYGVDWTVAAPRPGEKLHESLLSERDAGLAERVGDCVFIRAPADGFSEVNRSQSNVNLADFVSSGPVMSKGELQTFLEAEGEL